MSDSQLETALLCSCLALPKVAFILRACPPPPSHINCTARDFDTTIRQSLEAMPISDWSWLKASLPSNQGGLNFRSAVLHAPAAYLASNTQSCSLVEHITNQNSRSLTPHPAHCHCPHRGQEPPGLDHLNWRT